MKNIFNTFKTKANNIAIKSIAIKENCKAALSNNRGDGYLPDIIRILIAIVLGSLLLTTLYALFQNIVLPRVSTEISNMFDYKG